MSIIASNIKGVESFRHPGVPSDSRFAMPSNWQWAQFSPRKEQYLRYGFAVPENPKGVIAVFPGLFDFAEKYGETVKDLMKDGYAVSVVDMRGQGGSWRAFADRRHHDSIKLDVEDARQFLAELKKIPQLETLPIYALTHSLGGNIALGVMAEDPKAFKGAVMNAPMFGISLSPRKVSCLRWFVKAACALGASSVKMPGMDPSTDENWTKGKLSARFAQLTKDPERLDLPFQYAVQNPKLRMQPMTFGLVNYLLDSIAHVTDDKILAKIKTPVSISVPSEDKVVSQSAIRIAAAKLPIADIFEIKGGLHDTLSERSEIRTPFIDKIKSVFRR